eukprot:3347013-Amphidinium_carterae.2
MVLEHPVYPLCDGWNCCTFRYGEARHPGPEQRIVSVNPRGGGHPSPGDFPSRRKRRQGNI